ncbi:MAG: ATP-dependent helicase/nuclease subunit [Acidobacteriota bacterium]|nr:ATP-dependent helicase/nuclease subunit [Acidobacteriota bacterium]
MVHGARAAEALLLERLSEDLDEAARDPRLLARPVRVVVPSRSLTVHLTALLVARRGRSLAGITFQTLYGVAAEILERAGEPVPKGTLLFEVLAQRAAREQPALVRGLEGLVDGYAGVFGTVRDLLDAGFERAHAEAADEALAAALGTAHASRAAVERARALVRVAARVEAEGRRLGIGRTSHLLRRAAELVVLDPERFLPSRALYVHGFADATGLATDLLTQLLRRPGSRLLLDRPLDPAAPPHPIAQPEAWEQAFSERFAGRLTLTGARFAEARPRTAPPERARLARLEAAGTEAEVRGVALRLRALLDAGIRPEGIGVVARDLAPYRLALRRQLGRLGLPFSGLGARGAVEPAGRRAAALLDLLRRREETPCDRWLDAAVSLPTETGGRLRLAAAGRRRIDLRLAVRALGAGRLRDLAALDAEALARVLRNGWYALPIRQGLRVRTVGQEEAGDGGEAEGEGEEKAPAASRAAARTVAGTEIERAAAAARALCRRFAEWPDSATAADHLARAAALLRDDLGWHGGPPMPPGADPVAEALDRLGREVPAGFLLRFEELRLLLARALVDAGRSLLGGKGGGVQVLSVTEARGRTFEHLFLIGMNRDVFPRTVREDPLLPDALRTVLAGPFNDGVLPDVPVKRQGFDEERYLFAQLLSAAPAVTLSWQSADDDGRPRSPSPLVERLLAPGGAERLPPLYALPAGRAPRPADEHAILAALHAPRRHFGRVLPLAVAAGRALLPGASPLDPQVLAAARMGVLDELDPDRRTPEGRAVRQRLGPWFGFVGALGKAPAGAADPRHGDLWVTHLEGMAACPWQTFLTRVLKLEPTPDPLEALPGVDALLLGNLVHAVLEAVVLAAAPEAWQGEEAPSWATREPIAVPWPAPEGFERLLRKAAEEVVEEEGISLPGMARALAERARPFLEVARQAEWGEPGAALAVVGAEVFGEIALADPGGRQRRLRFKADRIDRVDSSDPLGGEPTGLRLTDYKTGRPVSTAKREDKRAEHFLASVRAGTRLQAVAYRLAGGAAARGRYLYLRPDLAQREFAVGTGTSGDAELERAFGAATAAVLGAWEAGTFFPRVVDLTGRAEPGRCKFCGVAEACIRGDSGARGRLFEWAARGGTGEDPGNPGDPGDPGEAALLAVWGLPGAAGEGESP